MTDENLHFGQEPLAGHYAGLGVLVGLYENHESHGCVSFAYSLIRRLDPCQSCSNTHSRTAEGQIDNGKKMFFAGRFRKAGY